MLSGNVSSAEDTPPPTEENYDYPGAEKIFQERGILLRKGDGHILLVDCGNRNDLVEAWSRSKGRFCFQVSGSTGYLSMELPQAYLLKADSHVIQATITIKDRTDSVTVPKTEFKSIGEGADPNSPPATLLELKATAAG
ncbi:hypothetical protein [Amycolatopsis anabasis]|uniref:hypothetical protein n=1 Tax=Amycolatopsis anabasis TaxID=1840409 RepID=UPI00131C4272|nr:hypothetical protein [Amycolatopsis anabasis]